MPKNRESERAFGSLVEKGSSVTHDDSNYGHAFDGCAVTTVNSKPKESHFLMNPVNRFCCRIQRIFAVHLRIHRSDVQKYPDALCADYVSDKENYREFLSENRGEDILIRDYAQKIGRLRMFSNALVYPSPLFASFIQ